jgi:cytochrome P450
VDISEIDLTDTDLVRNGFPHDIFTTLRREEPVKWHPVADDFTENDDTGFWMLTKFEDVQAANRNCELFSAIDGPGLAHSPEISGSMLVAMDGRPHDRQRKIISAGFTPRMVGRLEEQAREWARKILKDALERGTCNFVQDVAYQLPMHMIADIMGIPFEDRARLFELTNQFLQAGDPHSGISLERHMEVRIELFQYAQKLGQEKRSNPQDDIWTILSTIEVETDEGEPSALTQIELDMFFLLLTLAGSETTRNAISSGLLALLDNPDQLETLRTDPSAMAPAVEEILRWSSPVSYFARRATRDTEVRGVPIAKGERITMWYPSANRDEEVFEDPFRFDIGRTPNHHVAFGGGGRHYCLGANLARREITILFEELLARTSEIEVVGDPVYTSLSLQNPILVAPKEIPVRLAGA